MAIRPFSKIFQSKILFHSSIKIKILAVITALGVILSLLLSIYSPTQAKKLGRDILINDAKFITNLLAENLSLGMQTLSIDEGASLKQSIDLLKYQSAEKWEAITDIFVYDIDGMFIAGLNQKNDTTVLALSVTELKIEEYKRFIRATSPLRDADKNLVGFVKIDFSKKYLNQKIMNTIVLTMIVSLLLLLLTLFLGLLISREISGGIQKAVDVMQVIARGEGDLTKRLEIRSTDEVGQLQNWINQFMEKIHDLIVQVKWNTDLVSHTVNAISITTTQMAEGSGKQAERAIEAASTVDRITMSIGQNARHATETTKMAEEATLIAKDGTESMKNVLAGMNQIVESIRDISKMIYSLSRRTDQIGEVIHIIDDIAVQTNLLAINASIEATRAGDEGKGFMVIADEIHRLSDQTIQSTQMIVDTIKSIQTDIRKASESMKETENTVDQEQKSTMKTEEVLTQIIHTVRTSMEMMKSIASTFAEQGAGVREVSTCVDEIGQITKQASSGIMAVALASKEMKLQTEALHNALNNFKLKNSADRKLKTPIH